MRMRKHYSSTFKAEVVQALLKGEKTLAELASQHGIHPSVLSKWKRAALKARMLEGRPFQAATKLTPFGKALSKLLFLKGFWPGYAFKKLGLVMAGRTNTLLRWMNHTRSAAKEAAPL